VVDVQERALRALEEHVSAVAQGLRERSGRVVHVRLKLTAPCDGLLEQRVDIDGLPTVVLDQLEVLLLSYPLERAAQRLGIE
jgi:hypothetical protein